MEKTDVLKKKKTRQFETEGEFGFKTQKISFTKINFGKGGSQERY